MTFAGMGMDASHPHAQRVSMDPQCPRHLSVTQGHVPDRVTAHLSESGG